MRLYEAQFKPFGTTSFTALFLSQTSFWPVLQTARAFSLHCSSFFGSLGKVLDVFGSTGPFGHSSQNSHAATIYLVTVMSILQIFARLIKIKHRSLFVILHTTSPILRINSTLRKPGLSYLLLFTMDVTTIGTGWACPWAPTPEGAPSFQNLWRKILIFRCHEKARESYRALTYLNPTGQCHVSYAPALY